MPGKQTESPMTYIYNGKQSSWFPSLPMARSEAAAASFAGGGRRGGGAPAVAPPPATNQNAPLGWVAYALPVK